MNIVCVGDPKRMHGFQHAVWTPRSAPGWFLFGALAELDDGEVTAVPGHTKLDHRFFSYLQTLRT